MFLSRLELVGFKSFAPRTTTDLLPGIAVVVGPNGSGKSNIADAVRWVLGEQSAKAVRARRPEEVIFAGSASRQPLGMAEVSLILDNADNSLPVDFREVRITRRLYRSGDSEYLLNGSRVRLKDITQLLLHAGMSADSYAVIGQGSVDELILQRPDERRVAFENAADIRRHQVRLNDTRGKLAGTQTNLTRVEDILAELAPHVKRLKGQAERAARAEAFRSELHDLLLRTFRLRLLRASAEKAAADQALATATGAVQEAEVATQALERALEKVDSTLAGLDEQLAVLRPRRETFREQARAAERGLAITRERLAGIDEQRAAADQDLARVAGRVTELTREQAGFTPEPTQAETGSEALEAARRTVATRQTELVEVQRERANALSARDALERRTAATEERLARLAEQAREAQANLAVAEARQTDRQTRLTTIQDELEKLSAQLAATTQRLEQARAALTQAAERGRAATASMDRASRALRAAQQQADRLHGALATLGAAGATAEPSDELPETWRTALADLPLVGVAGDLARRVQPIDRLLRSYLQRTLVLTDTASAREAHRRLSALDSSDTAAWAVLSLDGVFLTPPGEHPLEAAAPDGGSVLADWRRQVRDLEHELVAAEQQRSDAEAELAGWRAEVDSATTAQQTARATIGALDSEQAQLRRAHAALLNEQRQLTDDAERARRAAEQRTRSHADALADADRLRDSLVTLRTERDGYAEKLRSFDERVAALSTDLQAARGELASLETAAAQRQAERQAGQALRARITTELMAARQAHSAARLRLDQLVRHAADLRERETELTEELQDVLQGLTPIEERLAVADQRRSELLVQRREAEQRLIEVRHQERAAHERREASHVRAQRTADELERIQAEIAETAELDGEASGQTAWAEQLRLDLAEASPQPPDDGLDLEVARRRISVLQRELRSIGGVADSVVVEYREMSERHDFLVQQSADLRAAMTELQNASAELETHMRDRFAEVFRATEEAFQECFVTLFGGGEARLVLTDPDDMLRSGIDIVARPPGKKMQGLLSLSGGERALTVVALLFGLLKVNPTPFCVLDEVDAALDEANVQRFANLLAGYAQQIQFIVVTHNRATMDKADALYGVSMDAHGVSRIFAVQPRAVVAEAAAVPA